MWTVGVAWHLIGIKDYLAGTQLHLVAPFLGSEAVAIFTSGILAHITSMSLIARHRTFYFG